MGRKNQDGAFNVFIAMRGGVEISERGDTWPSLSWRLHDDWPLEKQFINPGIIKASSKLYVCAFASACLFRGVSPFNSVVSYILSLARVD